MRRKSRNSARNSRFSQSELNFYTIKISYSESGQKTESTDVYLDPIRVLRFFSNFHAKKSKNFTFKNRDFRQKIKMN
jgi:hypothetical protein